MKRFIITVGLLLALALHVAAGTVSITSQPSAAYGRVGDRLDFYVTAYGEGIKYAWYWRLEDAATGELLEERELGTACTASLTLTDEMADPAKKSYVYCLVSDNSGEILTSEYAEAGVRRSEPLKLTLTYQPAGEVICSVGEEVMISVAVDLPESALGTLSYQWYRSGTSPTRLDGETKPYLIVPTDIAGVSGYYCVVTNEKDGVVDTSSHESDVRVTVKAAVNLSFEDVKPDAWYYESVRKACVDGLLKGKSPDRFCPGETMTVAEAVTLACRLNQLAQSGVVDLANGGDVWYSTYMEYALNKGIIKSDLSDIAGEPVTRGLFAEIFASALPDESFAEVKEVADGSIPDVQAGSEYEAGIYKLYRAGVLTGYEDGTFRPDALITRAEAAVVAIRAGYSRGQGQTS